MDAKSIIKKGIERWNAHDRAGFLELFDAEAVFGHEPTREEFRGPAEVGKGFYDVQTEAYPDNQIKDVLLFSEGDLVCLQARFVGTHTGIFRGPVELPPTGKHVESPFVFVAEVHGDKVKSARMFYDRMLTLEQEGIITPDILIHLPVGEGAAR